MRKRSFPLSGQTEMQDLLSPAQTARLVGVTTARIRQLSLDGTLPFQQTPNGRVYRREDVEQFVGERSRSRNEAVT